MLIGNTWVKGARLRILNCFVSVPAATTWVAFPETLVLNNEESAFTVGFQMLFTAYAGGVINFQVLYDGTAAHEGYFRASTDSGANSLILQGNQQPTSMGMPLLDVPPDTEIGVRARFDPAGGPANCYIDLYVISYYMKDQEPAAGPVCFPPSAWPLPCP